MHEQISNPVTPAPSPIVSKSPSKDSKSGKKDADHPLQYYSDLMKHDAHCKVGGRIRQRRWGKS
jgi:hypothetical protein